MYQILDILIYLRYIINSFSILSFIRCLLDTMENLTETMFLDFFFFLQIFFCFIIDVYLDPCY